MTLQPHGVPLVFARDAGARPRRERALGVLALPPQPALDVRIFARIDAEFAHELLGHEVDQALVPIAAAQVHVAVGRQGDELAPANLHHGDVERAAAQVVDQDVAGLLGCPRCGDK